MQQITEYLGDGDIIRQKKNNIGYQRIKVISYAPFEFYKNGTQYMYKVGNVLFFNIMFYTMSDILNTADGRPMFYFVDDIELVHPFYYPIVHVKKESFDEANNHPYCELSINDMEGRFKMAAGSGGLGPANSLYFINGTAIIKE